MQLAASGCDFRVALSICTITDWDVATHLPFWKMGCSLCIDLRPTETILVPT